MALANPASDFCALLDGQTLGSVTLARGTNLFAGPMRSIDVSTAPCVFVANVGGPPSVPYLGGTRLAYWRPHVQVIVRGAAGAFEVGEQVAREVLGALHLHSVPMAAGGSYVEVAAQDSAPGYLGPDESDRPIWSLNFEAQYTGAA